ncbi:MAG: hypothetical protein ACO1O6_13165 [Bacteroidota bacterium]
MNREIFFCVFLFLLCSCKKTEFQSCSNFEKIKGEWISIDGDTETKLIFNSDGSIVRAPGIERTIKYDYTSCAYKQKYNENDFYFLFENNKSSSYIDVNETFDTILLGSGAYDHTNDELNFIYQIRFVKVK